jgi:hypothetical protein
VAEIDEKLRLYNPGCRVRQAVPISGQPGIGGTQIALEMHPVTAGFRILKDA